jgi:hypothetical protein
MMIDVKNESERPAPGLSSAPFSGGNHMHDRRQDLQSFVDAAFAAFDEFSTQPEARRSILAIFATLERPEAERSGQGSRLPVCSHLDIVLADVETGSSSLHRLIEQFRLIEPRLEWRRRASYDGTASENFVDGHANAMIIGPGGLEHREDIWLGVTLMAPNVRYPNHDHAPEEVYLVLSKGEFRQGNDDWFSPGTGGSFYNAPEIRHAMRSVNTPFFAFWALLAENPH